MLPGPVDASRLVRRIASEVVVLPASHVGKDADDPHLVQAVAFFFATIFFPSFDLLRGQRKASRAVRREAFTTNRSFTPIVPDLQVRTRGRRISAVRPSSYDEAPAGTT